MNTWLAVLLPTASFQSGRKERTQRSLTRGPRMQSGPSAPPSDPRGDLRLARGLPAEALDRAPRLRLARG